MASIFQEWPRLPLYSCSNHCEVRFDLARVSPPRWRKTFEMDVWWLRVLFCSVRMLWSAISAFKRAIYELPTRPEC